MVKIWVASRDGKTRESHREADGQVRLLGEPFRIGDAELMMPRDPEGPPGETYNCRCQVEYKPLSSLNPLQRAQLEGNMLVAGRRRLPPVRGGRRVTPAEEVRLRLWEQALKSIRKQNSQDPQLVGIQPREFVPTPQQLRELQKLARLYEQVAFTPHGGIRSGQRGVPHHIIVRTIRDAKPRAGHSGRLVYELSASRSPTGRGIRVVVEQRGDKLEVVTVIDLGSGSQ